MTAFSADPGAPEAGPPAPAVPRPRVAIEYCPRCGWLLRSAWLAQELLTTFTAELAEVALIPSQTQGCFRIYADAELIWCRQADGGFPQAAELKRRLRDRIAPARALGHLDRGE